MGCFCLTQRHVFRAPAAGAGMRLLPSDYVAMGKAFDSVAAPLVFVSEGGYRKDIIGTRSEQADLSRQLSS